MRTRAWLPALALAFAVPLVAGEARAQRLRDTDPYLGLKLMLGFEGEAELEAGLLRGEDDLEPTWGGGLQYVHPFHPLLALGVSFSLQSWQTDGGDALDADRNVLADLALLPQLRLPLTRAVELYAAVPIGPSMSFLGEDQVRVGGTLVSEVDPALGLVIGGLIGARFALSDGAGLLAEIGYLTHAFEHEVTVAGVSGDVELDLGQLALHLGAFF